MNLFRPICVAVFLAVSLLALATAAMAQSDTDACASTPGIAVAQASDTDAGAQAPESAVAQSNDVAQSLMNDAVDAAAAGEFDRALDLYAQAADSGSTEAMLVLGAMYLEGFGVEANATQGGHWFERAAEAGDALAQYNLGYLSLMGLGRDQSMEDAFDWFRLAAEQGHAEAMHNLALMYEEGLAGPKNPALAYFWGLVAEREGASNTEGLTAMFERLDEQLTEEERDLATELAGEWRPVAP